MEYSWRWVASTHEAYLMGLEALWLIVYIHRHHHRTLHDAVKVPVFLVQLISNHRYASQVQLGAGALLLFDKGLQALLQVLFRQLLATVHLQLPVQLLRRDDDAANDVDDAILDSAIGHTDALEAVDTDIDQAAEASNVDGEIAVLEQCRQIDVELALGDVADLSVGAAARLVVGVRVERLVGDDVVLEQGLEVFLAVLAEEEGVDLRAEALEGEVGGSEDGAAEVVRGVVDHGVEAGLDEAELERAELGGEEADELGSFGGWD